MNIKRGIYKHYKGKLYSVIGTAHHSETLQEFVVYIALYDGEFGLNSIWIRPKDMFLEEINLEGKKVPRFEYLGEKNG